MTGVAAVLVAATAAPAAPLDDLLRRIPEHANAVLLVNVRAIYNSPLGTSRNWAQQAQENYVGGLTRLPAVVDQMLVAQHIDPNTLTHNWRLRMLRLNQDVTAEQIAQREAGTLDTIGGVPVVLSRGSYFVHFNPRLVAETHPADRQKLSRWIKFCQTNDKVVITPYLLDAVAGAGLGAQAVFAIDLKDVFDPAGIAVRLKAAPWLAGKDVDRDALTRTLAGLLGVRVNIQVDQEIRGEIHVDFSGSADAFHDAAKLFILGVMENMGASIGEMQDWQVRFLDKGLVLSGTLTEQGARLLLSPSNNQLTGSAYAKLSPSKFPDSADPKATASLLYYRSLSTLLDELRAEKNMRTVSQRGYWFQQYAHKIESLPLLNIDPDLLQFAAQLSSTLRQMALVGKALQSQNSIIQANQFEVPVVVPTTYWGGGTGYGWRPYGWGYGGYGWTYTVPQQAYVSNYEQVRNLCWRNASTEKEFRMQTWKNIDEALFALRRKMTEKYQIEF
jgi:hypothetical protein